MKNRRRFLVWDRLSPRNFQPGTKAKASSEHARVKLGVPRGTSLSAHARVTVGTSHPPPVTSSSAHARVFSPAVVSDGDDDSDAPMDTFSLDGGSTGLSAAASPTSRDDIDLKEAHEVSPDRYADDPGHQLEHPSYEALRKELIDTKDLLADVMGQQGEYELVISKMAFKQKEQLIEMKAEHERESVVLVDLVADMKKSCGNRLEDMKREHEEAKRALMEEAEELRQKMARTEGAFDLYVVNLRSNHEKHISQLRDALLDQQKEIEMLMEAQSSFAARLEAAQKEQQQNDRSEGCRDLSTECEAQSENDSSVEQINKSAAEISQEQLSKTLDAVEEHLRKSTPGKDEDPGEVESPWRLAPPRENEIHAKYGSFISELHMVHRRECLDLEEKISEQERELKQLRIVNKSMEEKSTDDFEAAMAAVVDDYNEMIADANAANKEAKRQLNKQLVEKTKQIEELLAENADQKAAIEATERDLQEAVLKCEDINRDHKSEAAALSHVISELHNVHTKEVEDLRRQLALKDERIEKLEKGNAYLDSSLTTMTKTLESIAGKSSGPMAVPSTGQPTGQGDFRTT